MERDPEVHGRDWKEKRKAEDDVIILLKIIVIIIKHVSNNINRKLHISAAIHSPVCHFCDLLVPARRDLCSGVIAETALSC